MEQSESVVASDDLPNIQRPLPTNDQEKGDLLFNHNERVQNLSDEEQLIKIVYGCRFCQDSCPWTTPHDEGR